MKKITFLKTLLIVSLSLLLVTCKKNKNNDNSFTVQYIINPASNFFTQITYTDQNGQSVTVNDLSTFPNGVKEITVATGPFDAKITTQMNNTTLSTVNYSLVIAVDGQVRTTVPGNVAAMSTFSETAEIIIQ